MRASWSRGHPGRLGTGRVAERTKAAVLKTAYGATRTWVRIPPLPPQTRPRARQVAPSVPQSTAPLGLRVPIHPGVHRRRTRWRNPVPSTRRRPFLHHAIHSAWSEPEVARLAILRRPPASPSPRRGRMSLADASDGVSHLTPGRIERRGAGRVRVGEAMSAADELETGRLPGAGVGDVLEERRERLGQLRTGRSRIGTAEQDDRRLRRGSGGYAAVIRLPHPSRWRSCLRCPQ